MQSTQCERAKQALRQIVDVFENEPERLPQAVAFATIAKVEGFDTPASKWSLGNRLLMFLADTNDARTYNQWQEIGRQVKRGTKAFFILAPVTVKKSKRITDNDGNESTEDVVLVRGFKGVPVFRYEDTDGDAVSYPDYAPAAPPRLAEVAAAWNIDVSYVPSNDRWWGLFSRRGGADGQKQEITLATHDETVFFHELAHAAHCRVVTEAGEVFPDGARERALKETVAELAAAALGRMYGLQIEGRSYQYIRQYVADGQSVGRACLKVLSTVETVLDRILSTESAFVAVAS